MKKQLLRAVIYRGGGGTRLSLGRGVPLGVENLTLSQTARRTKNTPCHNYLTKTFICIPLYWDGRTLYCAVYHHTFIKICCVFCVPRAPSSLVPRSRACHKHCGPARTVAQWARMAAKCAKIQFGE